MPALHCNPNFSFFVSYSLFLKGSHVHVEGGLPGCPTQLDIFRWSGAKGSLAHRFRAPPSLHCTIAYFVSSQSQQPVQNNQSNLTNLRVVSSIKRAPQQVSPIQVMIKLNVCLTSMIWWKWLFPSWSATTPDWKCLGSNTNIIILKWTPSCGMKFKLCIFLGNVFVSTRLISRFARKIYV